MTDIVRTGTPLDVDFEERVEKSFQVEEELAETMIPLIGRLYRRQNAVATVFGEGLVNISTIDILNLVNRIRKRKVGTPLKLQNLVDLLQVLSRMDVNGHRLDLGKLELLCKPALDLPVIPGDKKRTDAIETLLVELHKDVRLSSTRNLMERARDVVLYGFGRIGRILARLLIEKAGSGTKLMLRAVVVRPVGMADLQKRVDLFLRDSVHGGFPGTISVDKENNAFTANGVYIRLLYSENPSTVDYTKYHINNAILIDNTGKWRDRKGLGQHLACPGIGQVVLTAPGKGDLPNIVAGVNDEAARSVPVATGKIDINEPGRIISCASCTTNAVVPILKVMNDRFGIVAGHLETVHSYTNDQNLIDNFHKSARRGRAAALNMVLTETGAGDAVSKCLPELTGKLTANAIRVPTPNGSLAMLILTLGTETTVEEVNQYLFEEAHFGSLSKQIDITDSEEITSMDVVGSRAAAVVDRFATIVQGNRCNLYVWYDNEHGYSCQVIRVVQKMAAIEHVHFPASDIRKSNVGL